VILIGARRSGTSVKGEFRSALPGTVGLAMLFLAAEDSDPAKGGKQEVAGGDVTQAAAPPELQRLIVSKPKQKGELDA
jgi:hypothetical protein